jgi:hypothetical protein
VRKWDAREQRALAVVNKLRQDNDVTTSADYATLTGQLEEAGQQQTRLKEASEGLVENLKGQLEEDQTDLLRIKVRRSTTVTDGDGREDPGITLSSSQFDVRAPAFRPAVHFSTVEETTPQVHALTTDASGAIATTSKDSTRETALPVSEHTHPRSGAAVTSSAQAVVNAPTVVSSSMDPTPTSMGTDLLMSVANSVTQGTTPPVTTPGVSQRAAMTLTPAAGVWTAPVGSTGMPLAYPMMHPNLHQIPNFHGGDQRDGETFEDWWNHIEARLLGGIRTSWFT